MQTADLVGDEYTDDLPGGAVVGLFDLSPATDDKDEVITDQDAVSYDGSDFGSQIEENEDAVQEVVPQASPVVALNNEQNEVGVEIFPVQGEVDDVLEGLHLLFLEAPHQDEQDAVLEDMQILFLELPDPHNLNLFVHFDNG